MQWLRIVTDLLKPHCFDHDLHDPLCAIMDRALVVRCAEACALLRVLSSANLGRLAAGQLDAGSRGALAALTLRDLVSEPSGA